jgi:hypothetical protein
LVPPAGPTALADFPAADRTMVTDQRTKKAPSFARRFLLDLIRPTS